MFIYSAAGAHTAAAAAATVVHHEPSILLLSLISLPTANEDNFHTDSNTVLCARYYSPEKPN